MVTDNENNDNISEIVESSSRDEGPVKVDLSEVDDDDASDVEASKEPGQRMTRRERRRQNSFETIKAEYENKLAEQSRRLDILTAQIAQSMAQRAAPAVVQEDNDPVTQIENEQNIILSRLSTQGISKDEEQQLIKRHRMLDRRRIAAIKEATAAIPSARVDRSEIERVMLESEFPEVFSSTHACMAAQQELHMLMANGAPGNIETARKAAKNIAVRLKAATSAETSDAQKAKYGGVSLRPGNGSSSNSVTLDPAVMSMAREWAKPYTKKNPNMSDKEIAILYAKNVMKPGGLI